MEIFDTTDYKNKPIVLNLKELMQKYELDSSISQFTIPQNKLLVNIII